MAAHANSRPSGSEDAFSDIPDFTAKPHDTGTGYRKAIGNKDTAAKAKRSNTGEQVALETGTKVYLGKKITDSNELNHPQKIKDTTLTDVSIDTDFEKFDSTDDLEDNGPPKFSETTITTIEVTKNNRESASQSPLVVDDTPNITVKADKASSVVLGKKEKVLPPNISLDITPGEYQHKLPSGNESIPLGSGVITGVLGTGGMAKVFRIWNEKLEVYRAIKILIPTNQKIAWTRFLTEAKISAKLHHPNIIEVHTIGDWNGVPYIEMDIVEGETLSSLISRFKALPSMLVSAIAVQVARALAYAHCQELVIYGKTYKGLIHRDLKPSNIMIDKNGIVKLMDFGVARPVETGLHTIDTENIVGTVHYFSPEQISGYPVDPLSDIYSFGAVIYEMLCGSNPFPQTTMIQLIRAKEKNQFIRLEDFEKLIDPRLASAAQVCLRTDKNSRFQTALDLCNHLEEIHRLLRVGTAEEVVRMFLQDPQKVYRESELKTLQISREESMAERPSQTVQVVEEDIEEVDNSSMVETNGSVNVTVESDSEYLRVKRNRNNIFIVIIILLGLLLVAGVVFFGNNIMLFSNLLSESGKFAFVIENLQESVRWV